MRAARTWLAALLAGLGSAAAVLWSAGSAEATMSTVAVPYMGWNPYYASEGGSTEATFKAIADSLISTGLQAAGYKIFWLDYGWASGARDSTGQLTISSTQWPTGMVGFTTWLHQHGFEAGIYTDAGSSGCSSSGVGSYGHYQQDADTFAAWGFDAVKVDFCGAGQEGYAPQPLYQQFSEALANNSSGRPMILNVCNFWTPGQINGTAPTLANSSYDNYQWAPSIGQSWRTDTDIGFVKNIQFQWVLRNLDEDASEPGAAGPPSSSILWGHWNDPDYLGPQLGMTATQARSQFSMWAMLAAPLILGNDPRKLSTGTLKMLENTNVLAIDQDSLGAQATLVSQTSGGQQVWAKPLADGSRAVAFLNRSSTAARISTTPAAVGLPPASSYTFLNAWTGTTWTSKGTMDPLVGPDAVVIYRVKPVS